MEITTMVLFGIACLLGGLVGSFIWFSTVLFKVTQLEQRISTLHNNVISVKGVTAKQENSEEMQMALAEGLGMFQSGKDPKEIMATIAMKYPKVAMNLVKKL